jgi:hypothetical protein
MNRLLSFVLLSALGLTVAGPANALIPIILSEFTFTGVCAVDDCTGDGIGVLTLENYSLGGPIHTSNFVSFSYKSNLTSLSLDANDVSEVSGSLPAILPAAATVEFLVGEGVPFFSSADGSWCTDCSVDQGQTSVWSAGAGAAAGEAPEPATWAMMLLGFAGLGFVSYRQRQKLSGAASV